MIKLTGLIKRYPGRTVTANAVDGLDLEIPEGKLVSLLGPSGCGKTTTLRMIAGLERNNGGVIEIDGKVVSDPSRRVFLGADRRHGNAQQPAATAQGQHRQVGQGPQDGVGQTGDDGQEGELQQRDFGQGGKFPSPVCRTQESG